MEGSIPASYAPLSPRLTQVSIGGNGFSGGCPANWDLRHVVSLMGPRHTKATGLAVPALLHKQPPRGRSCSSSPIATVPPCAVHSPALSPPQPCFYFCHHPGAPPPACPAGNLYTMAGAQLQSTNLTYLSSMCGMVSVGFAFANGFDLVGSPGLGLPCPEEVQAGWPDPADDF